jgi:hypothetical protein
MQRGGESYTNNLLVVIIELIELPTGGALVSSPQRSVKSWEETLKLYAGFPMGDNYQNS